MPLNKYDEYFTSFFRFAYFLSTIYEYNTINGDFRFSNLPFEKIEVAGFSCC